MKLRFVTPDIVEVPEIGRFWRIAGGVSLVVVGVALLYLVAFARAAEATWMMGLVAVLFVLGGASIAVSVKKVVIDRANGLIIKRQGKFRANRERCLAMSPKAIRLTLDRESMDDGGIRDMSINNLFVVHEKGETLVASCRFSLGKLRALAEELAQFLTVERYEDRLFKMIGALSFQTGPGTQPTRTYIDRNTSMPVPPEDRKNPFRDCEELRDLMEEEQWAAAETQPNRQ